jgi:hypothetical protein
MDEADELMGEILNLVIDWTDDFEDKSPTPEIVTLHSSRSSCVNRLDMNEVDEPLSSNT